MLCLLLSRIKCLQQSAASSFIDSLFCDCIQCYFLLMRYNNVLIKGLWAVKSFSHSSVKSATIYGFKLHWVALLCPRSFMTLAVANRGPQILTPTPQNQLPHNFLHHYNRSRYSHAECFQIFYWTPGAENFHILIWRLWCRGFLGPQQKFTPTQF